MHELSVCLALMQQIQNVARQHDARSVSRVELSVGPLSGVDAELLRNAYPLAAAGTIAADAELVITSAAVVVKCNECAAESEVPSNRMLCSACGGYLTRVISGEEMILSRLELDRNQAPGPVNTNSTATARP